MMTVKTNSLKNYGIYFLGLALMTLAASIFLFTQEIINSRSALSDMLQSIEDTAQHIEPVIQGLNDIQALIPPILQEAKEIRELIPSMLDEISEVRKTIPSVLNEASEYRSTVPLILKEILAVRNAIPPILNESSETRAQIPAILITLDQASSALNKAAEELESAQKLVPLIVAEVEATRNMVDPTLKRVDTLINNANDVGKNTTEGAITGVVTGIVKAPFSLFKIFSSGKNANIITGTTKFSDSDLNIAKKVLYDFLSKPITSGSELKWNNPVTDLSGIITLVKQYQVKNKNCITVNNYALKSKTIIANKKFDLCQDAQSNWVLVQ